MPRHVRSQVDWRIRSGSWRALLPGVYLTAGWAGQLEWDQLPWGTRLWAARLMHGPVTVFSLDTAARLREIEGLGPDDATIHVCLPRGTERHQVEGVRVHTWQLDDGDVTVDGPWLLTTPRRTVMDLVLRMRREYAVSVLDSALNRKLLVPEDLTAIERDARGMRGAARSRPWFGLADGRAETPLETRARLIAVDLDLPPDELQLPIRDHAGILLGFADLAWKRPHRRTMVVEADGRAPHDRPRAVYRDRYRANDFADTGEVDLYRITWDNVIRPAYFVNLLRRNLVT